MNIRFASLTAILMAICAPAMAGGNPVEVDRVVATGRIELDQIAREAGISVNDVRMVLGSRTQFAQYRVCYDRKEARVKDALERIAVAQREAGQTEIASIAKP